jgi:hypothetical protein
MKKLNVLFVLLLLISISLSVMQLLPKAETPKEDTRFTITQQETNNYSGLWLTDTQTQEQIAIYHGKDQNSYIGFWNRGNIGKLQLKIAYCADGIQVVNKLGQTKFISIEELLALDKPEAKVVAF